MIHSFKKIHQHPFAVKAFFRRSLVLAYAFPKNILEPLLHPGLSLDTYGPNGFAAIALVETQQLRPHFLPAWMGRNFFLLGFRIFVRFKTKQGRNLRGLQILKSLTDSSMMARLGNLTTHYRWEKIQINSSPPDPMLWEIEAFSDHPLLQLRARLDVKDKLPQSSPFPDLKTARRFAGPMPYTFSLDSASRRMLLVRGHRQDWNPQSVDVEVLQNNFFAQAPFNQAEATLANAFFVENVAYRWDKGELKDLA